MKKTLLSILFLTLNSLTQIHAETLTLGATTALRDPLKTLAEAFHKRYPEHTVQLSLTSSGALYQQINRGSAFDMVAFGDDSFLTKAIDQSLIRPASHAVIARDQVVMATLNTQNISTYRDLNHPRIDHISLANTQLTSIGIVTKQYLKQQGLWDQVHEKAIQAKDTQQAYNFIANSVAEVGFVYLSDTQTLTPKLKVLATIPGYTNYSIATTTLSDQETLASLFKDFVLSDEGQKIMHDNALLPPQ